MLSAFLALQRLGFGHSEGDEDDDESLPGDDTAFEPAKAVEQALRLLESGQQLPPQPVAACIIRKPTCIGNIESAT